MFLLTSKFRPQGVVSPTPGLYTCTKPWKKLYKIRLQGDFFKLKVNDRSDKKFLVTSKCCPLGVVCPWPAAYTLIKSWRSEVEEILLNLQQMTIVMRSSCLHQNFCPNGLSAPAQGLCLNFFSSIIAESLATYWAHSEDSDQTGRMPRLTWVFAGRTGHFGGFVVRRHI